MADSGVFDKPIVVKKNEDGTFQISVAIVDSVVSVKTIARSDAEQLYIDLETLLDDSDDTEEQG